MIDETFIDCKTKIIINWIILINETLLNFPLMYNNIM